MAKLYFAWIECQTWKRGLALPSVTRPWIFPAQANFSSLVEMAMDQFTNHLDQFLHRAALRRHFRLMANDDEQSFFFADIEI